MWTLLLALIVGSASAEEVAAVLTVTGTVNVAHGGADVAATPNLSLDRADVVKTGEDGAVILLLSNNRVVRIDEDLVLPVAKIVLLGAPPTTEPVKRQLDDLLYPGESASMRGYQGAERMAGFQARMSAGTAIPAQSATSTSASATSSPPADAGRTTRGGGSSRSSSAAPPPAPPPPPGGGGSAGGPIPPPPPPAPIDPTVYTREQVAEFAKDAACLASWRDDAALTAKTSVVLHVRVKNGVITRVYADGGLVPGTCTRDRLFGTQVSGGDGVFDVTVEIP